MDHQDSGRQSIAFNSVFAKCLDALYDGRPCRYLMTACSENKDRIPASDRRGGSETGGKNSNPAAKPTTATASATGWAEGASPTGWTVGYPRWIARRISSTFNNAGAWSYDSNFVLTPNYSTSPLMYRKNKKPFRKDRKAGEGAQLRRNDKLGQE